MVWTKRKLEKINTEYSFNDLDFTKLNTDNIYLIKVNLSKRFSKEDVARYCQGLKEALNTKGLENVVICPIQKNSVDLELYKLEKEDKDLKR